MPMTPWNEIAGLICKGCGNPASHIYCDFPICCKCHGGNYFTESEIGIAHEAVLSERRATNKYFEEDE